MRHRTAAIPLNERTMPQFADKKVRQAMAYAIDRQALVDNAARGYGVLASPGLFAVDNHWYNSDVEPYDYDPAKTEELMEELGYSKVDGYFSVDGSPVKLEMLVTSINERAGELIRQQLEDAGFMISLRTVDSKTLDSMVTEWKFDLALNSHGGMGADPEILKRMTGDGYTFNSARYTENSELNELLDGEVAEIDEQKREDLIDRIQVIHAQELPVLPLYYADTYWAHDGRVEMYYTRQGIANGVPLALNKQIFVS
ncbi:MAG TPA: ABC transporter substrate-binding protein [Methanothrix soehngenii]|nr:ABC transporter substrate-binding protein [Methanothrix soehngenii]